MSVKKMITASNLSKIYKISLSSANNWVDSINQTMTRYDIQTPIRIAHFLAQIGHESANLCYVKEIASGRAYEGRKDLGNIHAGDGVKYKGRGLIQVTGLRNYTLISDDLGVDFVNEPQLLETHDYAALSAGWYWGRHNLNYLADRDRLIAITQVINGGQNGIDKRRLLLVAAKMELGIITKIK